MSSLVVRRALAGQMILHTHTHTHTHTHKHTHTHTHTTHTFNCLTKISFGINNCFFLSYRIVCCQKTKAARHQQTRLTQKVWRPNHGSHSVNAAAGLSLRPRRLLRQGNARGGMAQQRGAPPDGPLRCLQALLARFPHAYPDKDELRSAVRHANYCSRPLAAQCIERHLAGDS
jgi:hypothetical protein